MKAWAIVRTGMEEGGLTEPVFAGLAYRPGRVIRHGPLWTNPTEGSVQPVLFLEKALAEEALRAEEVRYVGTIIELEISW